MSNFTSISNRNGQNDQRKLNTSAKRCEKTAFEIVQNQLGSIPPVHHQRGLLSRSTKVQMQGRYVNILERCKNFCCAWRDDIGEHGLEKVSSVLLRYRVLFHFFNLGYLIEQCPLMPVKVQTVAQQPMENDSARMPVNRPLVPYARGLQLYNGQRRIDHNWAQAYQDRWLQNEERATSESTSGKPKRLETI